MDVPACYAVTWKVKPSDVSCGLEADLFASSLVLGIIDKVVCFSIRVSQDGNLTPYSINVMKGTQLRVRRRMTLHTSVDLVEVAL